MQHEYFPFRITYKWGINGKQPKCHSNKCGHISSIKYYPAIKNDGDRVYVSPWKNPIKCNMKERITGVRM